MNWAQEQTGQKEYSQNHPVSLYAMLSALSKVRLMQLSLKKIAPYPTDHATVMLKWIVGKVVATVDAGKDRFTYAIIDTVTEEGLSGEGSFKGTKDIEKFYSQFQTAITFPSKSC